MTDIGQQRAKRRKRSHHSGGTVESMSMDEFLNGGFEAAADSIGAMASNADSEPQGQHTRIGKRKQKGEVETLHAAAPGGSGAGQQKGTSAQANIVHKSRRRSPENSLSKKGADKNSKTLGNAAVQKDRPKKQQTSESAQHQDQLAALKDKDPEFYNYLLETDKELLEFKAGDSDEEEEGVEVAEHHEEDQAEDEDGGPTWQQGTQQKTSGASAQDPNRSSVLTQALVDKWCHSAKEERSMAALHRLIKAYRMACHLGDQEETLDAAMKITSSTVFNKILLFVIKEAGGLLRSRLGVSDGLLSPHQLKKAANWRKVEPLVKSFLGNSLHLLSEMTDEAMVVFLLKHLRPSVPFLICSDRLQRKFLKQVLQLFGEAKMQARVQAVLFLRAMATALPPPFLSLAMKGAYRTFVVHAKFMSPANLPHINFMASCVVELFGLDSAAAYEHAFGSMRQLAILVKGAQSQKSKEAFREVYCWQTVTSMELWAKLLATHSDREELRPLIYPVAQLLTAAVRLVPTARYFPLRLRCIKALNKLGQASGSFIPVAPLLLEALQWSGLSKHAKAGGKAPSDAVPQLRAGKQILETVAYQQALVEEVFLLLAQHLAQWSTNVSFPEYANTVVLQIQQVAKTSKIEKFRSAAKGLIAAVRVNAEFVIKNRQELDRSPSQAATLADFLASPSDIAKAPMAIYADVLAEKAARQRALHSTAEIAVGDQGNAEADDSGEEMPNQDLLPELKRKSAVVKAKFATKAAPANTDMSQEKSELENEEGFVGTVQDFKLSDSEDDSLI